MNSLKIKTIAGFLSVLLLFSLFIGSVPASAAPEAVTTNFVRTLNDASLWKEISHKGTVSSVRYKSHYYIRSNATECTKYCTIYLPYGYSSSKSYDVLILVPGMGMSENCYLNNAHHYESGATGSVWLKNLFDNAIEDGRMKPMIVVNINYYGATPKYGTPVMELDANNVAKELRYDILPFIVNNYSTYASSASQSDISAARDHFGVFGFSYSSTMIGRTIMPECLDLFGWYGASSVFHCSLTDSLKELNARVNQYPVRYYYCGCGDTDNAHDQTIERYHTFVNGTDAITQGVNSELIVLSNTGHDAKTYDTAIYNCATNFFWTQDWRNGNSHGGSTTPSTPAPTAAPTPAPTATPAPTPTPVVYPVVKVSKDPTDEYIYEGRSAYFVARASNAKKIIWHIVRPDESEDFPEDTLLQVAPNLKIKGLGTTTLQLSNVPAVMDGWKVRAEFTGGEQSVFSKYATVHVSYSGAVPTPIPRLDGQVTPTPEPTPAPTATPKPTPTPTPTQPPVTYPVVKVSKDPTDEYIYEGRSAYFVARASNTTKIIWHIVRPDESEDFPEDTITKVAKGVKISGLGTTTLQISKTPASMNGWKVRAEFLGGAESVYSKYATIHVSYSGPEPSPIPRLDESGTTPAATPAPTAVPTPTPAPTPAPNPNYPTAVITKHPTDEYIYEGRSAYFVARASGAQKIIWHITRNDGTEDFIENEILQVVPALDIGGQGKETFRISKTPAAMDGWKVRAEFVNQGGSVFSNYATIHVTYSGAAPTPIPRLVPRTGYVAEESRAVIPHTGGDDGSQAVPPELTEEVTADGKLILDAGNSPEGYIYVKAPKSTVPYKMEIIKDGQRNWYDINPAEFWELIPVPFGEGDYVLLLMEKDASGKYEEAGSLILEISLNPYANTELPDVADNLITDQSQIAAIEGNVVIDLDELFKKTGLRGLPAPEDIVESVLNMDIEGTAERVVEKVKENKRFMGWMKDSLNDLSKWISKAQHGLESQWWFQEVMSYRGAVIDFFNNAKSFLVNGYKDNVANVFNFSWLD